MTADEKMVETEVYIFIAAVALMAFGTAGLVARMVTGRKLNLFKYLEIAGVIGILLVPTAFFTAAGSGRLSEFTDTVLTAPLQLLSSAGTGVGYTDACQNGRCAIYCCNAIRNSSVRWKDCDEDCGSMPGVTGVNTGDDCQYDQSREARCLSTGVGSATSSASLCNHDPSLGTVTCTCCTTADTAKYWDCQTDCSSNPAGVGFPAHLSACATTAQVFCHDDNPDVNSDVSYNEGSSQVY